MTRISTAMVSSSALQDIQRSQRTLFDVQNRAASQKVADDLKGYGRDTNSLVTMNRMRAKEEAYVETAKGLQTRLSLQDLQLGKARGAFEDLKLGLTEALALDDFTSVPGKLDSAFTDIKNALNARYNNSYTFGGVLSDVAPVQAGSIADLAAAPLDDALGEATRAQTVRIDDNRIIAAAPVGRDLAGPPLDLLRDLALFDGSAAGPFQSPPTDAQRTAVKDAIARLSDITAGLLAAEAANGQAQGEIDDAVTSHQARGDLLESLTAGITDVDLAEVAVQLNQAQTQFQATASVFNTIQNLSLVNFLR